jgi:acyl-CoA thioesterase
VPEPTSIFHTDTAVTSSGDGRYHADVASRWNIGANPNGGYLLAIAVRAMLAEAGRPDPLTVTAHYLAPPVAGPVEIRTTVVKPGRSLVTVTAEVWQGERERVRLLGSFGDLAAQRGPSRVTARPPSIAPPDACITIKEMTEAAGREAPEAMSRYDLRLPRDTVWGRTPEEDPFEITGWIRFGDDTPTDTLSLVAFADAFPPTLIGSVAAGWVPTIELTVHVRARPEPGWLLGTFRTRFLVDGLLEEDGELWDASGRPVALSRQLALVLQPRR